MTGHFSILHIRFSVNTLGLSRNVGFTTELQVEVGGTPRRRRVSSTSESLGRSVSHSCLLLAEFTLHTPAPGCG